MRVVLDTNILCSALLTPGGPTDRLYRAWRDKRFELITSEEQLDELRRITRYPRVRAYIEPAAAGSMLNELRRLATFVTKLPADDQSRDPGDNFLLAMVQVGRPMYSSPATSTTCCRYGHFGARESSPRGNYWASSAIK